MTTSPHPARTTLAQVARLAGVSPATASKVLNDRPDVSDATRLKVRDAIAELDYRPTTTRERQGLELVQVVLAGTTTVYTIHVLDGLIAAAEEAGVQILIDHVPEEPPQATAAQLDAWARRLLGPGLLGAVFVVCELTPGQIEACRRVGVPAVAIDSYTLLDAGIVSIGATNFAGGLAAAQHLIDLGHQRIGIVGGPTRSVFARERVHAYRAALAGAGIEVDPQLVRHGRFSYESGLELGGQLLDLPEPPTGIVAACDLCALGVIEAARSRGKRVPEDLSVVGFDDTSLAIWSSPQLTTVRQPLVEMGRVALRTVLRLAAGQPADSPHVQLATTLVTRNSTTRPPA